MRWYVTIIIILSLLAALAGVGYATGYVDAITAGFSEQLTPPGTHVAGVSVEGLDRAELESKLEELDKRARAEKLILWVSDDEYFTAGLGELGFAINPVAVADEVFQLYPEGYGVERVIKRREALQRGLNIKVPLALDGTKLRRFIMDAKGNVDQVAHEAFLDFENQRIADEVQGRILDVDATIAAMPETIYSIGPVAISAVLDKTVPKITASDFNGINPNEPLSTFKTKFNARKRNRSFNIGHLAGKFRGVTIKPGETFSFNAISGPRDEKAGFKTAPEYIEHRIITGFGGGSCQVSTTLYNAALLAGLKINERQPHSRVVEYVPYGRDATVNYDSRVDLKFTNTLTHAIVIWPRYSVEEGWLQFDIFGNPDDRKEIEITNAYTRIYRDKSKDEFILDPKLPPGKEVEDDTGTNGIKVQTWRHFIQPDGSKITEKLFYDVIKPVSRVVRYNPAQDGVSVKSNTTSKTENPEDTGNPDVYF